MIVVCDFTNESLRNSCGGFSAYKWTAQLRREIGLWRIVTKRTYDEIQQWLKLRYKNGLCVSMVTYVITFPLLAIENPLVLGLRRSHDATGGGDANLPFLLPIAPTGSRQSWSSSPLMNKRVWGDDWQYLRIYWQHMSARVSKNIRRWSKFTKNCWLHSAQKSRTNVSMGADDARGCARREVLPYAWIHSKFSPRTFCCTYKQAPHV